MTAAQILRTLRAAPFRPFAMHLVDGRELVVQHRDFVQLIGGGRIAQVWPAMEDEEDPEVVDVLMIVSLRPLGR